MTIVALKLLLAPLLVVASSLAGRRWGPQVAGVLVVLPVVAGPILLILYLDHGSRFAAHAACGATLGIVPLALFALVFGYLSRHHGWLLTLAVSWIAVLAADLALAQVDVPAGLALGLALSHCMEPMHSYAGSTSQPRPFRQHRGGICRRGRSQRHFGFCW
jgi:hypothetical protein